MKAFVFVVLTVVGNVALAGGVGSSCPKEPAVGEVRIVKQLDSDVIHTPDPLIVDLVLTRECDYLYIEGSYKTLSTNPATDLSNIGIIAIGKSLHSDEQITVGNVLQKDGRFSLIVKRSNKAFDLTQGITLVLMSTTNGSTGMTWGLNSYAIEIK